jgi:hypothetical protein
VPRPLPAVSRRYLIVVLRRMLAAALVMRRMYLVVVPRPMPAVPRSYLIFAPGRRPRRRSLCVAGT